MASKDASFKSYVVAKCGITALNMETMTLSRTRARVVRVKCSTWQHQIPAFLQRYAAELGSGVYQSQNSGELLIATQLSGSRLEYFSAVGSRTKSFYAERG